MGPYWRKIMRLDPELAGRSRYRGNGSPFFDMMLIFVPNKQECEHDGRCTVILGNVRAAVANQNSHPE